jgi:hypothetical protein
MARIEHEDQMKNKQGFSAFEAREVGEQLGLDWTKIDLEQFRRGLEVELEHGKIDSQTNITDDNLLSTGKIAWAHLKEIRDYYTRLDQLEAQAKERSGLAVEHWPAK